MAMDRFPTEKEGPKAFSQSTGSRSEFLLKQRGGEKEVKIRGEHWVAGAKNKNVKASKFQAHTGEKRLVCCANNKKAFSHNVGGKGLVSRRKGKQVGRGGPAVRKVDNLDECAI